MHVRRVFSVTTFAFCPVFPCLPEILGPLEWWPRPREVSFGNAASPGRGSSRDCDFYHAIMFCVLCVMFTGVLLEFSAILRFAFS